MTKEDGNTAISSGLWAWGVLILAIPAYFLLHAWLDQGVDRPDPHPLQVEGRTHVVSPQAPQRHDLAAQAAPYS
ncbi:hypothetical protein [Candidatus Igneacidithiobacillus taiwanensis]|uniref:hypothetical protein n=1 Tax=Candidatus Igneacidithiobacillus taiwanensis TaxID=1945924 RepID=UPI0028A26B02|nr:hypothetical protein [Candidatus Igneacidithiobacillus taiwanensis]